MLLFRIYSNHFCELATMRLLQFIYSLLDYVTYRLEETNMSCYLFIQKK